MARRSRRRLLTARRYANGRLRSREADDYRTFQRLRLIDEQAAVPLLQILAMPPVTRSRDQQAMLQSFTRAMARRADLSFPVGIARELGFFGDDGDEIIWASDHYAALHRQIWGSLPREVEERMVANHGPDAFSLLLQVGRVTPGPAPPMSVFRNLLAEEPREVRDSLSPDEEVKRRWRIRERYWGARRDVQQVSLSALLLVEGAVVEGVRPSFVRPASKAKPLTEQEAAGKDLFIRGLYALALRFGILPARDGEGNGRQRGAAAAP